MIKIAGKKPNTAPPKMFKKVQLPGTLNIAEIK
jgi:hypothetical protein